MSLPLVHIIILNWNGLTDTTLCLESLKRITYTNCRIVVVDNGSREDEAGRLEETFGDQIHVIRNADNLGFVGGCNVGIRHALNRGAHYVLLLNNDVTVESGFLDRMIAGGQAYPTIGILGPKIYLDPDRRTLWSAGGWVDPITSFTFKNTQQEPYHFYAELVKAGYIIGASVLIKREVIEKVGLLDERFFAYEEDIEYCVRARRNGYDSVLVTSSIVYHRPSSSTQHIKPLQDYYMTRNSYLKMRVIFADTPRRFFYGSLFMTMVNCVNIIRAFRDEGWVGRRRAWAVVLGMWDALVMRRFGKTKRYLH